MLEWTGLQYEEIASDLGKTSPFISLALPAGVHGGSFGDSHYVLRIFGLAPSNSVAANYAGVLSVVAVPEPSKWVMLLAGFGIFGVIALRRTNQFTA